MRREVVVFQGREYVRYPDSPYRSARVYFYHSVGGRRGSGSRALHRDIWEHYNGPIPPGHIIHHKDENPLNNSPGNLECITYEEHARRHPQAYEELKARIDRARAYASAWHGSDEGREFHRRLGAESWKARKPVTRTCDECGSEYDTLSRHGHERFCSLSCRYRWWEKNRTDYEERICEGCGGTFSSRRSKVQRTCSRKCAWVVRRREG